MKNYRITIGLNIHRDDVNCLYDMICKSMPRAIGVNLLPKGNPDEQSIIILTFMATDEAAEQLLHQSYTNLRKFNCDFDLKLNGPGIEKQENFHQYQGFTLDFISHVPNNNED